MKVLKGIAYWLLSCTWGIIMTVIGLITALVMLCIGKKPHKNGYGMYFVLKNNMGSIALGPVAVVSSENDHTLCHEYGHSWQNAFLGPFFIILCAFPSLLRCLLVNLWENVNKVYAYLLIFGVFSCLFLLVSIALCVAYEYVIYIVFICVSGYCVALSLFLCGQRKLFTVDGIIYDAFWVEGWATKIGIKYKHA